MRVTTKGRYALRAITNLVLDQENSPKSIRIIAAEEQISPEFLEQIFFKLKKTGILNSMRGPTGGFFLAKPASDISLKDILIAVDEGLDLTPCTACEDDGEIEHCGKLENCMVHQVWRDASDHIVNYFSGYSLQKLIDKQLAR